MEIPTASSLNQIYPEDAIAFQKPRWESLLSGFKSQYGHSAEFVSRSAGRVNLIGEHIDYSLYEVLPMAVTADLLLAVSVPTETDEPRIRIANANGKYPAREFEIPSEDEVEIDATSHEWSNYFKAGLRGASQLLRKKRSGPHPFKPVSMDILVDGNVPQGGGLSSSAAFVCASALAVMKANGQETIGKRELVEIAIVAERAVGVNSGGMDQSASVFGQRGSALYVSFKPHLNVTTLNFPSTKQELVFITAHSMVTSDKQVTAPVCYNLRVVECSIAASLLARIFKLSRPLPQDSGPLGVSLRGFHDAYFEELDSIKDNTKTSVSDFQLQLEKLVQLTEDYLIQEEGYTREQLCALLGISMDEFKTRFESSFPIRAEHFMLRQRALHVFTEAIRVGKFMKLMQESSSDDDSGEQLLRDLGELMNLTQESCRDLYECSCPELDELCELARGAGAYGSRLTGAGWGGCCVHLVPKEKVEDVKKAWVEGYYKKKFPDISEEQLEEAIVVSEPGSGATLFPVSAEAVF
ncbi:galactokinase [Aulographum hederae CBS 113979]|uniref:Galactokinase n=1 Tax=Aulographum hederae CBS 113979 TaxID=1176131 RepID=A0A6G1GS92_9PEZI|nr:galactokinase [Aulographum hederae CBS 113979]